MQPQQRINAYFSSCFVSTYFHFALPRTAVCSLIPHSIITPETIDAQMKKVIFHLMQLFYFLFEYKITFFHFGTIIETKAQIEKNHVVKRFLL